MRVRFYAKAYSKTGKYLGKVPVSFETRERATKRKRVTKKKAFGYNYYSKLVEKGQVKRDRKGKFKGF